MCYAQYLIILGKLWAMKRREFIKKSVSAGLFASAVSGLALENVFAEGTENLAGNYDLVAIKGGEPAPMFDKAMAAMGGMEAFVKKGQSVVIKPNIGWDKAPEFAANTNPLLVKRIVEHCLMAGASSVYVFDNTCNEWSRCYSNSGIQKVVKEAGGKMVPANTEGYYQEVAVGKGVTLQATKVHELILESDVFINVPVLKNHGGAKLSMAMKNLMGVVWDRRFWHRNGLDQCIADFSTSRVPDLNIMDAYNVMLRNGPMGVSTKDVANMKSLLISPNMVTMDTAGAKMFGMEPDTIDYIVKAQSMGIGSMDLSGQRIKRLTV